MFSEKCETCAFVNLKSKTINYHFISRREANSANYFVLRLYVCNHVRMSDMAVNIGARFQWGIGASNFLRIT